MRRIFIAVALGVMVMPATGVAELYRYIDNRGVTVLDSRVPPEYISNGYEVLDAQGRVREVIPASPTQAELEAMRRARTEQERQRVADSTLLRLYSDVRDLDRAHARQVAQIDNQIVTAENELEVLQAQREDLQRRAADQERAGRPVEARILESLADLDKESDRLRRLIELKREEITDVDRGFAAQRERLSQLTH
ncbi:DUF4124 domain-containing protein [Pseudomonas sp. gcc21]|uniref:DUF4124 domain-containing protein n=1 Tax=Pseudomonas sp. gcc21 TaxID=2726989 RepID=UPI0014525C89|nr:DUF4124 domain-containing protein [Pseudomonas sp. gcc21]QJD59649.1 DUF4124 domain-containing protein [Pseudomonas sp. gcc21]